MAEAAFAATLATMTVSCFDVTLGDSEVLGAFLTIVALGYTGVRSRNDFPDVGIEKSLNSAVTP